MRLFSDIQKYAGIVFKFMLHTPNQLLNMQLVFVCH